MTIQIADLDLVREKRVVTNWIRMGSSYIVPLNATRNKTNFKLNEAKCLIGLENIIQELWFNRFVKR